MKLIISTLFAFVLFDNSFKLSSGNIISTIEHDVERGVKVIPKVVKDSAPIVGRLPVVGPAATLGRVIGTDMKQAFHPNKQTPHPSYPRRDFRPRVGGYREFYPRAGGFQGRFNPRAGEFHGGLNPRVEGFAGGVNPRAEFARGVNPRAEFAGGVNRFPLRTAPGEFQRFGRIGQIASQQGMYSNVGYPQYNN